MYHTIGQRQGLGIGGTQKFSDQPWYVIAKKLETNELIVGQGNDHPSLFKRSLVVKQAHWLIEPPQHALACAAKIRYRQTDQACVIYSGPDNTLRVEFESPQRAITPGQSAVFYDADRCLGGGVIECAL